MKCVIFDMDGTLIDSAKAICETVNEVRRELGLRGDLAAEFIVKAINEPGRNLGLDFYGIDKPDMKLRDNFEAKFKKNYREYAAAYEGVDGLLAGLKEAGHFVALASNAPRYTLDEILQRSGIFKFFDLIVGADENIPQKPDPAMLNLILKSGEFDKAIFVGDSKKDELAARNADMRYLNVCWGFGSQSPSCDNVFTVAEVALYIEKL